ncbi:hypothetical protein STTU_3503 [Streptomyces sp. Tu6071]|uniref:hypothetical protein n=1 Tax=Streptomyces sp. Tu6071 TaxID=355249 RepID=UPI00020E62A9|nr:hypothetical protein [Streptomyces sp. Tu6071]EGJ76293.1 hypothetical protein STTU_3503 [Streptomyces sp. Tu6071]
MFKRNQGERDARTRDRAKLKAHLDHPTFPYNPDYDPERDNWRDEMLPLPKFESRRFRRQSGQSGR